MGGYTVYVVSPSSLMFFCPIVAKKHIMQLKEVRMVFKIINILFIPTTGEWNEWVTAVKTKGNAGHTLKLCRVTETKQTGRIRLKNISRK